MSKKAAGVGELSRFLESHLQTISDTFQMMAESAPGSLERTEWSDVVKHGGRVYRQATVSGFLWSGDLPDVETLKENIDDYFNVLQRFLLVCQGSLVSAGPTLHKSICGSAKNVVDSSFSLFKHAVSACESHSPDRNTTVPQLTKTVWDACAFLRAELTLNYLAIGRPMSKIGDSGDSTAEKSSNGVVDTSSCSDRDDIPDLGLDDDDFTEEEAAILAKLRKKGKPKLKSQGKLHPIVVCEHERQEAKPLKLIRTKKLIHYVRPIGQVAPVGQTMAKKEPEIQSFGCWILKAIDNFLDQLHKNYTLKGKININMLCWIKSTKTLKLRKDSVPDLQQYTEEGARMDYTSLGTSISNDLFKGWKIPLDVKAWIDLMLDDPIKHKDLIRYNIALLPRRAKMDHFLSLYGKLSQLRDLAHVEDATNETYYSVVDNIPVANSTPGYVWTSYAMDNKYVQKVYTYKREGRSNSAFGLLMFVRDCVSHLLDYSVEGNVVLFGGDDKYLMIETCFGGVFHQFQRAMFEAGLVVLEETL